MRLNGFVNRSSMMAYNAHIIQSKILHKIFEYEPARRLCERIFRDVAEEMKIDIQESGFGKDHVHMIADIGLYSIEVAKKFK